MKDDELKRGEEEAHQISIILNGRTRRVECNNNLTLIELVRDKLKLKGTKEVCGIGECGACTIIKDGKPVSSCCELAIRSDGSAIETIEGLAVDGKLHPLQRAFIENSAFQCGFCTSGMIMMAKTLLDERKTRENNNSSDLSEEEIRSYMSGNLCRCTGYQQIVEAIKQASREMSNPEKGRSHMVQPELIVNNSGNGKF